MPRRLSLTCVLGLTICVLVMPSAAAGGGCHPDPEMKMTTSNESFVAIGKCAFVDTVVHIQPGDTVTWHNKDAVPHSVSGAAYSWGSERLFDRGDQTSYKFDEEGVYPYYCVLHPGMVGAVVVGDATKAAAITNGMAAVSDAGDPAVPAELEAAAVEPGAESVLPSALIGIAILATLGAVLVASRVLQVRRRAASAIPAP